jgi:hypothetical protein
MPRNLEHDPEKRVAVSRKDHAQTISQSAMAIQPNPMALWKSFARLSICLRGDRPGPADLTHKTGTGSARVYASLGSFGR